MNIVQGLILGFLALSYISGTIVAMTILLENRDPSRTVTWLLIFILLPGVGLIIYAVFGRNLFGGAAGRWQPTESPGLLSEAAFPAVY